MSKFLAMSTSLRASPSKVRLTVDTSLIPADTAFTVTEAWSESEGADPICADLKTQKKSEIQQGKKGSVPLRTSPLTSPVSPSCSLGSFGRTLRRSLTMSPTLRPSPPALPRSRFRRQRFHSEEIESSPTMTK